MGKQFVEHPAPEQRTSSRSALWIGGCVCRNERQNDVTVTPKMEYKESGQLRA
jgi:hypothetical protein